jgi:uncharacterized membrane protein
VACAAGAVPSASDVHDELFNAGNFLGRPADTTQSPGRSERSLSWIHIAFLFAVSLTPFSTTLLAEFPEYRIALVAYWLNIALLGSALYFSWMCATKSGLVKDDVPPETTSAITRRIAIAQGFYVLGALLCIFSTYWSIAFIVVVQLNYAIAPRFTRRFGS